MTDLFHPLARNDSPITCGSLESCEAFQALKDGVQGYYTEDDNGDYADDATWVLTSSFVILTMQSGFGLLEMGNSTNGNEVHIMIKNVADVIFGSLAYWLFGYGISYGTPSTPFMGLGQFGPNGTYVPSESGLLFSRYIFQFSFAATSTTIVSGCVAMRMKFMVYCLFAFFSIFVYAFVAHWVWADDGFLKNLGMHDFAGGGPVHLLGGVNGLVAILMLGPRAGRFDGTRPKSDFRPASPVSMLFGLFMLWWGWIGFNCGSSFGITGQKWVVATRAAITTINATSGGGFVAILWSLAWTKWKLIRVDDIVNGILGSLVATTASCAAIHTYDALIVGAIGAFVAISTNSYVKHIKLDDPVGAIGVHLTSGIWGILAVGFYADGSLPGIEVKDGLFRGGGFELLGIQSIGMLVIIGWSCICTSIFFYLIGVMYSRNLRDPRSGLRVSLEEELKGADYCLHGIREIWHDEDEDDIDESDEESGKRKVKEFSSFAKDGSGRTATVESDKSIDEYGKPTALTTSSKKKKSLDVASGSVGTEGDISAPTISATGVDANRSRKTNSLSVALGNVGGDDDSPQEFSAADKLRRAAKRAALMQQMKRGRGSTAGLF